MTSLCDQLRNLNQPGLYWKPALFGARPTWTEDPCMEIIGKIAGQTLGLTGDDVVTVSHFVEGAFNKLYTIQCSKGEFIFRATLPVAPKVKTLSEVATISFLRKKTSIPIPEIIAYNADLQNSLGFELMLMERIRGQPLREVWTKLSWLQKGVLVQKIVSYMIQLYHLKFPSIGSLYAYPLSSNDSNHCDYVVGETVAHSFFIEDHIQLPLYRGPFPSSKAFAEAELAFLQHDISKLQNAEDPKDKEQAEGMSSTAHSEGEHGEETILYHGDLSLNNILVSPSGDITGIFLKGILSPSCKPHPNATPITTFDPLHEKLPELLGPDEMEDSSSVEFYNEELQAYKLACLRSFFMHEMHRQCPEWVRAYEEGVKKRDVLIAIAYCENDLLWKKIEGWVDFVLQGTREPKMSLMEAFYM